MSEQAAVAKSRERFVRETKEGGMSEREPHKLEPHELRYAEGKREADECRECGQAIWRVYHGPNRNHTVEPRDARSQESPSEGER